MFRQSIISAAVLALASSATAGPVKPRGFSSLGGFGDAIPVFSFGDDDGFSSSSLSSSLSSSSVSIASLTSESVTDFSSSHSFNLWGGLSSLNDFDSFFGVDNFCSSENVQVFSESEVEVCDAVEITVVQQQLAILTEFAKRVILTQVCEVEAQTIVLSQYISVLQSFSEDVRHISSRTVSFDSSVANLINNVCDDDGSIVSSDFGFDGSDIGSHSVTINGLNWNEVESPAIVSQAFSDCEEASSVSLVPTCDSVCSASSAPTVVSSSDDCGSDCSVSDSAPTVVSSSDDCGSDCSVSDSAPTVVSSSDDCGSDCSVMSSDSSVCSDSSDCSVGSIPAVSNSTSTADAPVSTDGSDSGDSTDSSADSTAASVAAIPTSS